MSEGKIPFKKGVFKMFLHVVIFAFSLFVLCALFNIRSTIVRILRPKKWYYLQTKYLRTFFVPPETILYILLDIITIITIFLILFEVIPFYKALFYYLIAYICLIATKSALNWIVFIVGDKILHLRDERYENEP